VSLSRDDVLKALKEVYPSGLDNSWLFKKHPMLGRMGRKKDLQGRLYHLPLQISKQTAVSHDSTEASSYEAASKFDAFVVTPPITNYARARLQSLLVRQAKESRDGAYQFLNVFKNELKCAMESFGDRLAKEAIGDGGGSLGQVGSFTATTITLKNKVLVHFFEIGMVLQASAGNGTDVAHTLLNAGAKARITGIDDDAGVLSFTDGTLPLSGIAALANDAYLFATGDFKAAAKGFSAWIPETNPGSTDSFYGVNRSVRPTMLAGSRYDGSNDTIDQVWIKWRAKTRRWGIEHEPIHVNPLDISRLELSKDGLKGEQMSGTYNIGYDTFKYGSCTFVLDNDIPPGPAFQGDMSKFYFVTNGNQPKLDDYDGLEIIRESATAYRVDFVCDYLFMTDSPWAFSRAKLPQKGVLG
jgi:hypothetical protein